MAQRTGALVFDELTDRYDIRFDLSDYYGGLHCGDCLEVFVRGKWKPTRMEYGQNWYLVGVVFCQVLFPEKSVGIPFFQQGIFPAFSGHYASLRMRACSIR